MEENIQKQDGVKICPRCGIENTIGSFCKQCGTALNATEQPVSQSAIKSTAKPGTQLSNNAFPAPPSSFANTANPYTKAVRIMVVILAVVCVIAYLFLWMEAAVSGVAVLVALFASVFSVLFILALMHAFDDIAAIKHNTNNKGGRG